MCPTLISQREKCSVEALFFLHYCPGFNWDRVSFHKQLAGLTLTSQSNRIFYTMGCHAEYLSGELAEGGGFSTQEQAEHRVVRTLHVVYSFYQYY